MQQTMLFLFLPKGVRNSGTWTINKLPNWPWAKKDINRQWGKKWMTSKAPLKERGGFLDLPVMWEALLSLGRMDLGGSCRSTRSQNPSGDHTQVLASSWQEEAWPPVNELGSPAQGGPAGNHPWDIIWLSGPFLLPFDVKSEAEVAKRYQNEISQKSHPRAPVRMGNKWMWSKAGHSGSTSLKQTIFPFCSIH